MGTCEKCKHWEEMDDPCARGVGLCHGLSFSYMNGIFSGLPSLEGQIKNAAPEMRTHNWFSCVYFEEKPKGPFSIKLGYSKDKTRIQRGEIITIGEIASFYFNENKIFYLPICEKTRLLAQEFLKLNDSYLKAKEEIYNQ